MEQEKPPQRPVILCVDDEPIGLMVRARLLELHGFSVLTASDGATALDLFRAHPVDLVLLDYMMPVMHGGEVASELRRMGPRRPIVMLSAYLTLPPEVSSQVDLCLVKGVPPRELVDSLRRLIARQNGESAA